MGRHLAFGLAFLLAGANAIPGWPQQPAAAPQGKEFVDEKAGFRLQVPTGWREAEWQEALVAFQRAGENVAVSVFQAVSPMSPQQFVESFEQSVLQGLSGQSGRKVSEEEAQLAGLPARKLVFSSLFEARVWELWCIILLSEGEYWSVRVTAPGGILRSPGDARYQEVQQILTSFQLLGPVLARVKARAVSPGAAGRPGVKVEGSKAQGEERGKSAEEKQALKAEIGALEKELASVERMLASMAQTKETEGKQALKTKIEEHLAELASSLAEAYYENGQFDRAIETVKKAIAVRPGEKQYGEQLKKFEQAKPGKAGPE